ncbi:MAG: hypothetical protein ACOWWR_13645 [Eubacteriales bacterium]
MLIISPFPVASFLAADSNDARKPPSFHTCGRYAQIMIKTLTKIFFIVLTITCILSCKSRLLTSDLTIYGYSLGDSLSNDYEITDRYGEYFEIAELINDKRVNVSTIKEHITYFTITLTSEKQFEKVKKQLENHFNSNLVHLIGETKYGVKLDGEEFFIIDSLSKTEYSLLRNFKSNTCSFSIYNEEISDSISIKFIPDFENVEVIEFYEFIE